MRIQETREGVFLYADTEIEDRILNRLWTMGIAPNGIMKGDRTMISFKKR